MHCKIDGKDYDEMFELCEKLLSDDRIKAKFLKGIPLYDPSTLEHGSLFPSNDQPGSDELDDWANPDGELPYDRIDEEIHKSLNSIY